MAINKQIYTDEPLWKITLGTGLAWIETFEVYTTQEVEALDIVADYLEEHDEFENLYADYYDIYDLCEGDETVDEYAEAHGLVCCGNHGIYIQVINIEKI